MESGRRLYQRISGYPAGEKIIRPNSLFSTQNITVNSLGPILKEIIGKSVILQAIAPWLGYEKTGVKSMRLEFHDDQFSFEMLRAVSHAIYNGADIGECLSTAFRIKDGDFASWHAEWSRTADRIGRFGDESLATGHKTSAREAYLRASNYYRSAEFFLHENPGDPRILETWQKSRKCFSKAGRLFSPQFESVEIPYEETTLPGYFFRADNSGERRPTLILNTGFDGTAEELYFSASGALRRGYNCLTFDGPGQGRAIREQKKYFRPDWEKVVTPVVDYLLSRPEVEEDRIAIIGLGLGGYFAPRSAAFEPRLSACIANGGVFDMFEGIMSNQPGSHDNIRQYITEKPEEFDKQLLESAENNSDLSWSVRDGMWKFGVSAPHEYFLKTAGYNLEGLAAQITCPTLICASEDDKLFPGQSRKLYDELTGPKKLIIFTAEEGAVESSRSGDGLLMSQRVFDWLDEILAINEAAA